MDRISCDRTIRFFVYEQVIYPPLVFSWLHWVAMLNSLCVIGMRDGLPKERIHITKCSRQRVYITNGTRVYRSVQPLSASEDE